MPPREKITDEDRHGGDHKNSDDRIKPVGSQTGGKELFHQGKTPIKDQGDHPTLSRSTPTY